jgi:hypothetical protein
MYVIIMIAKILTLPNEIFFEIFKLFVPEKITPLERQLRDLKFVSKKFYYFYHSFFKKYGTKYKLIKQFDPFLHAPPIEIPFKFRYTEKKIWVDFDIKEKKWQYQHLEQNCFKKFFCDVQKIQAKVGCKYLNFVEVKGFETYKKSQCERCKDITYCAKYDYSSITHSKFNNLLRSIKGSYKIEFRWDSVICELFKIRICIVCKDYLDFQSTIV